MFQFCLAAGALLGTGLLGTTMYTSSVRHRELVAGGSGPRLRGGTPGVTGLTLHLSTYYPPISVLPQGTYRVNPLSSLDKNFPEATQVLGELQMAPIETLGDGQDPPFPRTGAIIEVELKTPPAPSSQIGDGFKLSEKVPLPPNFTQLQPFSDRVAGDILLNALSFPDPVSNVGSGGLSPLSPPTNWDLLLGFFGIFAGLVGGLLWVFARVEKQSRADEFLVDEDIEEVRNVLGGDDDAPRILISSLGETNKPRSTMSTEVIVDFMGLGRNSATTVNSSIWSSSSRSSRRESSGIRESGFRSWLRNRTRSLEDLELPRQDSTVSSDASDIEAAGSSWFSLGYFWAASSRVSTEASFADIRRSDVKGKASGSKK